MRADCASSRTRYDLSKDACREVRPGGIDVIKESSDWLSFHDTLAYVEATLECHEGLAITSLQQAAEGRKIRTRTVRSSLRWVKSGDKYSSDDGNDIEFNRKDVIAFFAKAKNYASPPPHNKAKKMANHVKSALDALYPDGEITDSGQVLGNKIHEWLRSHGRIGRNAGSVTRTIQRVLSERRNALK